jgi:hypothetical protein
MLLALRLLVLLLQVLAGAVVMSSAVTPSPCPRDVRSPAFVFGIALLSFAALQALPSLRHGWAVVLGLGALLVTVIVIPDLLRSPLSCNESTAIADLRAIASAEAAYGRVNSGLFETRLSCLNHPRECTPNLAAETSSFVDPAATEPTRYGYSRLLIPGPPPSPLPPSVSKTSTTSFACTATPVTQGKTGVRTFCIDSTGFLCYSLDRSSVVNPPGSLRPEQMPPDRSRTE